MKCQRYVARCRLHWRSLPSWRILAVPDFWSENFEHRAVCLFLYPPPFFKGVLSFPPVRLFHAIAFSGGGEDTSTTSETDTLHIYLFPSGAAWGETAQPGERERARASDAWMEIASHPARFLVAPPICWTSARQWVDASDYSDSMIQHRCLPSGRADGGAPRGVNNLACWWWAVQGRSKVSWEAVLGPCLELQVVAQWVVSERGWSSERRGKGEDGFFWMTTRWGRTTTHETLRGEMDKTIAWDWRRDCTAGLLGPAWQITVKLKGEEMRKWWFGTKKAWRGALVKDN